MKDCTRYVPFFNSIVTLSFWHFIRNLRFARKVAVSFYVGSRPSARENLHTRAEALNRERSSARAICWGRPKRKVIVQGNKLEFGGALKAYLTSFMVPVPAGGFENSGLLSFCQSARAEGLLQLACRVKFGGEVRLRGTPASAVYIWGGRKWLPTVPCDERSRARHPTSLHLYDAAGFHHN